MSEQGAPKSVNFRRKPEHHDGATKLLQLEARQFKLLEVNIHDVHALHEMGWSLNSRYTIATTSVILVSLLGVSGCLSVTDKSHFSLPNYVLNSPKLTANVMDIYWVTIALRINVARPENAPPPPVWPFYVLSDESAQMSAKAMVHKNMSGSEKSLASDVKVLFTAAWVPALINWIQGNGSSSQRLGG